MAETLQIVPSKRRKLTLIDVEAIAKLVCRSKLTETEACHTLDILPQQWWIFKQRSRISTKFDSLIARIRGTTIENAMQTIEDCGNGIGMKQPDWRAHAFRLQVIAPERFSTQQTGAQAGAQGQISESTLVKVLDMLTRNSTAQSQLPATQPIESKAIECHTVPQLKSCNTET